MSVPERLTRNQEKYSLKWDIKRLMIPELELNTTVAWQTPLDFRDSVI